MLPRLRPIAAALLFFLAGLLYFARALPLEGKVLFSPGFLQGRVPFSLHAKRPPPISMRRHQADVAQVFVPWQLHLREEVRAGRLPLWLHSSLAGTPFLANDQTGVFSPGTLLATLFPRSAQLTVMALVRLLFAGVGMILLMRAWGLSPPAQATGAVLHGFSWILLYWLGWPLGGTAAMLPWLALGVERVRTRGDGRAVALLAGAVCFTLFAGHAETTAQLVAGIGLFFAIRLATAEDRATSTPPLRAAGLALGGVALGTLLAGIHVVPFLELLQRSHLWAARSGPNLETQPLSGLLMFFAADASGYLSWLRSTALDAPGGFSNKGAQELQTAYVGLAALALGVPALVIAARRRLALALAASVAVYLGVIFGLGPHWIYGHLPVLQKAHNSRCMFLVSFFLASLGALGVQALLERPRAWRPLAAGAAAAITLSVVAMRTVGPDLPLARGLFPIAAAAAVAAIGYRLWRTADADRASWSWALPAVCALDLLSVGGVVNRWCAPAEVFPVEPVKPLLAGAGETGFFAAYDGIFPPSFSAAYGLRDLRAYEPMMTRRWRRFYRNVDRAETEKGLMLYTYHPDADWLRVAGVDRYLLGAAPDPGADWVPIDARPAGSNGPGATPGDWTIGCDAGIVHQLQLPPLPRESVVSARHPDGRPIPARRVRIGASTVLQLAESVVCPASIVVELRTRNGAVIDLPAPVVPWSHRLHASRVDWLDSGLAFLRDERARPFAWIADVVIAATDEEDAERKMLARIADPARWAVVEDRSSGADPSAASAPRAADEASTVRVTRNAPGSIDVDASLDAAGWLVVQESWDPGWRATVDGKRVSARPANLVFQAIPIDAGPHRVELRYRPASFRWGILSTALGLGVVTLLLRRRPGIDVAA